MNRRELIKNTLKAGVAVLVVPIVISEPDNNLVDYSKHGTYWNPKGIIKSDGDLWNKCWAKLLGHEGV